MFNLKKGNKGFTLIELLVVIAIIGILSGVVLTSLNSARNKAKDARAISDLSQMRTIAEVIYSGAGSYTDICAAANAASTVKTGSDPSLPALVSDATTQAAAPICWTNGTDYCISVLSNGTDKCVGSGGKQQNIKCVAATSCN